MRSTSWTSTRGRSLRREPSSWASSRAAQPEVPAAAALPGRTHTGPPQDLRNRPQPREEEASAEATPSSATWRCARRPPLLPTRRRRRALVDEMDLLLTIDLDEDSAGAALLADPELDGAA